MTKTPNDTDIRDFFGRSKGGPHLIQRRAWQARQCGEMLVDSELVTRQQLLRALQLQDRTPTLQLGQCVVALGFATAVKVQQALDLHKALAELEMDGDPTEFYPEHAFKKQTGFAAGTGVTELGTSSR